MLAVRRSQGYVKRCHKDLARAVANAPHPLRQTGEWANQGVEITFSPVDDGFDLHFAGRLLLRHRLDCPAVVTAHGAPDVTMFRGNFRIDDAPSDHCRPAAWLREGAAITLSADGRAAARLTLEGSALRLEALLPGHDRLWLAFHAEPGETVWGGGEQMSYLALNGRRFPMWTSEPGVGRDKTTELTRQMDETAMAGGDYWNTNYPQPTILTSRWLALHLDASCYSAFDITDPATHGVEVWSSSARFECFAADGPVELVGQLSTRFGRQPPLPDWAIGGAIVGLKDGARSFERLDRFIKAGTAVAGIWCEDWDWRRSHQRYPDLAGQIASLAARGIRFLGYANPYLANDGILYEEAAEQGHFCRRADGSIYLVDFGEFDCGVLDFTREETCNWFADKVLGRELLDIGMAGWMADFGEYLPTDVVLADGSDPMEMHNRWPVLWADVNARALASRGKTGEVVFFMRAGFSGVQAHCPLLWAGDQSVDFTRHDGIGTVITGALSAGLVGNAYSHSDCGGYTSLLGNVRSAELLMRWCELAAFAPIMRSHEGNRPDDNLQYDSTPELLACFAAWSRVHAHLAPYVRQLCDEAVAHGLPAQRALFLHYPNDPTLFAVQDQFLYGADLLVAPVIEEGASMRTVILPGDGTWVDVWSGAQLRAGTHDVAAPLGRPPVYYRSGSPFAALFAGLSLALAG